MCMFDTQFILFLCDVFKYYGNSNFFYTIFLYVGKNYVLPCITRALINKETHFRNRKSRSIGCMFHVSEKYSLISLYIYIFFFYYYYFHFCFDLCVKCIILAFQLQDKTKHIFSNIYPSLFFLSPIYPLVEFFC